MALFHTTVVDNQIKALSTIGSASGAICTFDTDRAERLVSCVCEVASGASAIYIYATGKNLFSYDMPIYNGFWTGSGFTGDNSILPISQATGWAYIKIPVKEGKTYTTSGMWAGAAGVYSCFLKSNDVNDYTGFFPPTQNNKTFTVPSGVKYICLCFYNLATNSSNYPNAQLELNNTATTFGGFGTTYTILFGETLSDTAIYDAISGVLTRNDSTTKQLNSCNIAALDNETNNVYCDTGDIIDLKFILSVGKAIS